MRFDGEQTVLRVYLRNTDHYGKFAAHDTLVERALDHRMAGATVQRGFLGLDCTGKLLESHFWSPAEHVPVVVELVDTPEAIVDFLRVVETVVPEGLVTLRRAKVLLYRSSHASAERARARLNVSESHPETPTLPGAGFPPRRSESDGQVLKVFIREEGLREEEPLFVSIVREAQFRGLAGAAVFRAPLGLGASGKLRGAKLFGGMKDLPVVVEVVDTAAGIRRLLPFLNDATGLALATVEDVWAMRYRREEGWSHL